MIAEANYEQELLDGTNTDKIAALALSALPQQHANLLTNGGMEIWFRTTSGDSAAGDLVTADGWRIIAASGTFARESTIVDGSLYALKWIATLGGSVRQIVYNAEEFRGKTLTLTARVRAAAANQCYVFIQDAANFSASFLNSTSGAYETLIAQRAIDSATTQITVGIASGAATTLYVDNLMLALAPGAVPYHPLDPLEDTKRCQARWQQVPFTCGWKAPGAGQLKQVQITLPQAMLVAPVPALTSITTGTQTNCASVSVSTQAAEQIVVDVTSTAAGYVGVVDALITLDTGLY